LIERHPARRGGGEHLDRDRDQAEGDVPRPDGVWRHLEVPPMGPRAKASTVICYPQRLPLCLATEYAEPPSMPTARRSGDKSRADARPPAGAKPEPAPAPLEGYRTKRHP